MRVGMAKKRWIVMSQNAAEHPVFYHCISRVVDRKLVFGPDEKEKFRTFMRMQENFTGCRVVAYCLMCNHDMWRLKLSKKLLALPRHTGYESRYGQKTMDCDESECGGASGFLPLHLAGGGPQAGVWAG
jgi:hypothetical protein